MIKKFTIENNELQIDSNDLYSDKIKINSSPFSYDLNFYDSIDKISSELKEMFPSNSERFIFWDENVRDIYGEVFNYNHQDNYCSSFSATEDNKNLNSSLNLIDKFQILKFTKKEKFISIGGGITQDISAVTRALYKRGLDWYFVPTTLLAMADSCIGAKTALNHGGVKNQIALFSAPKFVFVCPDFLKTLHEDDVYSGFGEILKLVIIGGDYCIDEFKKIQKFDKNDDHKLLDFIKLSLQIKKSVIEFDEFEINVRRSLNYGHTIGHAIEPIVDYKIPHGVAVSIGMIIENLIAVDFNYLEKDISDYYNNFINEYIPKKFWLMLNQIDFDKIIVNLLQDKKTMSNSINFAVPSSKNKFGILSIDKIKLDKGYLKEVFNKSVNIYS
jgi:3-dehydroquinate synthase